MAISFVQSNSVGVLTSSVSSVTVTLSNTTATNLLVAAVMHSSATAVLSAPANWSQISTNTNSRTLTLFAYYGNPGGIASFTFTSTVSGGMTAIVAEFSGVAVTQTLALDQTGTNFNASSATMDSGTTATTTTNNELWFAALGYGASTQKTISGVTNSFTSDRSTDASSTGGTAARLSDYYKIVSTTGAANVSATLSGAANWLGLIATFAIAPTAVSGSDSGGGNDTPTLATITPAPTDGGAGGDTPTLATITPAPTDGGAGGDNAAVLFIETVADSASGSDSQSISSVPTALTVYGTNTAATTLTHAGLLATTTGGANVGVDNLLGSATGYGELRALGNAGAWAAGGSLPAPSGRGLLLDSTLLEGMAMVGKWTPTVRIQAQGATASITADLWGRISVYHSQSSTYTTVGTLTLAGQTILSGSSTTFPFTAATLPDADFGSGDKLYVDLFANVTANTNTNAAATLRVNFSSSSVAGTTSNQVVTPGYYGILGIAANDAGSGGDAVSVATTIDAGVATDTVTLAPITPGIAETGTGSEGISLSARPPLALPFAMPGVVTGGPYVTARGSTFFQNGRALPRLYGTTFYPATEGGTPIWQTANGAPITQVIDNVISTYAANHFTVLRPTDQWGSTPALSWDNPAIWTNMDYLVQQASLNGMYVQMDLSGWKSVLAADGLTITDPNNWTAFLQAVGAHYQNVPNILFYTVSGEPTFPRTASDLTTLVNFYAATTATLKAADPNHLVSPGGLLSMNNGVANWWQSVWQIATVDVCCYKTYSQNDLNNLATYSAYGSQTLNKPTVQQEFGMPQYMGDGVYSGQTFNGLTQSRASYFDAVYRTGEQNGTAVFIFWNYDHQGTSIAPTTDFPSLTDSAQGSDSISVPAQGTASIALNDAASGTDVLQALTQSYDVDPNSSPVTWGVIQQHAWSALGYVDNASGRDTITKTMFAQPATVVSPGARVILHGT